MKVLCLHAHFDDFEFVAAGTFELWRRRLGNEFQGRVVICTDGKAGHHCRTREETAQVRFKEQQASARIGGYEMDVLRYPNGEIPREACLQVTTELLAALWKVIRDFEPDYLLCPPLPADPLAGIHVDHVAVAEAVRKVAYMINVPHAFTPEYPADETASRPCKVPVIMNLYDAYMFGGNGGDLTVDVEDAFPAISEMTFCHQSQIAEWLPWVGRHDMEAPKSLEEWSRTLRRRFQTQNREMGLDSDRATEAFRVTAWGAIPDLDRLLADFPPLIGGCSDLDGLKQRLARWSLPG